MQQRHTVSFVENKIQRRGLGTTRNATLVSVLAQPPTWQRLLEDADFRRNVEGTLQSVDSRTNGTHIGLFSWQGRGKLARASCQTGYEGIRGNPSPLDWGRTKAEQFTNLKTEILHAVRIGLIPVTPDYAAYCVEVQNQRTSGERLLLQRVVRESPRYRLLQQRFWEELVRATEPIDGTADDAILSKAGFVWWSNLSYFYLMPTTKVTRSSELTKASEVDWDRLLQEEAVSRGELYVLVGADNNHCRLGRATFLAHFGGWADVMCDLGTENEYCWFVERQISAIRLSDNQSSLREVSVKYATAPSSEVPLEKMNEELETIDAPDYEAQLPLEKLPSQLIVNPLKVPNTPRSTRHPKSPGSPTVSTARSAPTSGQQLETSSSAFSLHGYFPKRTIMVVQPANGSPKASPKLAEQIEHQPAETTDGRRRRLRGIAEQNTGYSLASEPHPCVWKETNMVERLILERRERANQEIVPLQERHQGEKWGSIKQYSIKDIAAFVQHECFVRPVNGMPATDAQNHTKVSNLSLVTASSPRVANAPSALRTPLRVAPRVSVSLPAVLGFTGR
eukprot:TRINITY_DN14148_c0_g2_i1.p2 TRINITY_DN14148_c0_g2~~TRINITY_DN14148_c0_g2_i1.p2  ORF type:complete len:564 (+),score=74.63 TRINITY_DN14148_c0_g2_i1:54-1745(+)